MEIDGSLIGAIVTGIIALASVGAVFVRMHTEGKHRDKRLDELKDRMESDKLELKGEIDRFKAEYRSWRDAHLEDSVELKTQITRLEGKIDNLIDRIDRAGINGKH